jgi:hypothetical protein
MAAISLVEISLPGFAARSTVLCRAREAASDIFRILGMIELLY